MKTKIEYDVNNVTLDSHSLDPRQYEIIGVDMGVGKDETKFVKFTKIDGKIHVVDLDE